LIFGLLNKARGKLQRFGELRGSIDMIQQALGRIEARQTADVRAGDLAAAEFKVSSQFGEDGIIEHLIRNVPIERQIFIEFGVESYVEANTRFLLRNRNWSGLIMDGSAELMERVRGDAIYWRHNLKAVHAFITRENINGLISGQGLGGDVGLLSVDIDGNDYWVWEAISCISPRIVIVEYNSLYGPDAKVAVPYEPAFFRSAAHYSGVYYGCSVAALVHLAEKKGYQFVGTNAAANNAFFVRRDVGSKFPPVTVAQDFKMTQIRQSRSKDGVLNYLDGEAALREIADMPVIDVETGALLMVEDAVKGRAS
jgi:hypothetical protein